MTNNEHKKRGRWNCWTVLVCLDSVSVAKNPLWFESHDVVMWFWVRRRVVILIAWTHRCHSSFGPCVDCTPWPNMGLNTPSKQRWAIWPPPHGDNTNMTKCPVQIGECNRSADYLRWRKEHMLKECRQTFVVQKRNQTRPTSLESCPELCKMPRKCENCV